MKDGNGVTAGGVASGIDFALHIATEIVGEETAPAIQLSIDTIQHLCSVGASGSGSRIGHRARCPALRKKGARTIVRFCSHEA